MASIYQSIEILGKEKGIDPQVIFDAVKDAMLVAARKHFRTTEDMVVDFDEKGDLQIHVVKKVVEEVADPVNEVTLEQGRKLDKAAEVGGEIRLRKSADVLGRISAQTAKQVILQKIREAERESVFSEFSSRIGELVNCTIKRLEAGDIVVDMGKTEARLLKKEQSKLETYSVGDRLRCVIRTVDKAGKNAGVLVSRAAPELVSRLFEQEVPEIYDSTVQIKGCAREAGERTKIAVSSRDRDVDSVGACVGMKGMRVQSIIRELRGEKIDIIEYSDDPVVFATHALSPAKITRVSILSADEKHMEVIVDDSQLSLAIGKKGQNVRLAAKLLGWRIDIKSEEEKRQEVASAMEALQAPGAPVSVLIDHGLDETVAERLLAAGVTTVEKLGAMTPEELEQAPGMEGGQVEAIRQSVLSYYAAVGGEETVGEEGSEAVEEAVPGEEGKPAGDEAGEAEASGQAGPAQGDGGAALEEGEKDESATMGTPDESPQEQR